MEFIKRIFCKYDTELSHIASKFVKISFVPEDDVNKLH